LPSSPSRTISLAAPDIQQKRGRVEPRGEWGGGLGFEMIWAGGVLKNLHAKALCKKVSILKFCLLHIRIKCTLRTYMKHIQTWIILKGLTWTAGYFPKKWRAFLKSIHWHTSPRGEATDVSISLVPAISSGL
jgi:hypothetical protein